MRRGRLGVFASAVAVALAAMGCGATVPGCTDELTAGIVRLSEPSTADRALVTVDPGRAQEEAFDQRGAGDDVRICLGVSEPGNFTDDRRVVYAVRFQLGQSTEVVIVDASSGEVVGGGAIVPGAPLEFWLIQGDAQVGGAPKLGAEGPAGA